MTAEKFKRKLTAILSADVKGYSRLAIIIALVVIAAILCLFVLRYIVVYWVVRGAP